MAMTEPRPPVRKRKLPPKTQLFGIETRHRELFELVAANRSPWVVSVEGLGGIGKTALASQIARNPDMIRYFHSIA